METDEIIRRSCSRVVLKEQRELARRSRIIGQRVISLTSHIESRIKQNETEDIALIWLKCYLMIREFPLKKIIECLDNTEKAVILLKYFEI